ncbi:MAG: hypothetical protein H7203_06825 [Rhizobacter sp.]|nr:hypothetical protein [Burkholderiales bacterium]
MQKLIGIGIAAVSMFVTVATNAQSAAPAAGPVSASEAAASIPALVIAPGKNTVDALQWMTGCWQAKSARDGSTINETWLSPRGGSMLGTGQTFLDNKTLGWEAMRVYDEAGAVKFWLRPGLRNELTLTLEAAGDAFSAFSVTEGDTTTKLRYERKSATEMLATFRLEQGESRRGADFLFAKVECAESFAPIGKKVVAK